VAPLPRCTLTSSVTKEMIEAGRNEIESVWSEFTGARGFLLWDEVLVSVFLAMKEAQKNPRVSGPLRYFVPPPLPPLDSE
jgi:hypothetical protein